MFKNLKLKYPFLSIIAVIIIVCLIAIACKKKATEPSFTVEVEKVPGVETPKPGDVMPFTDGEMLKQFKGYVFKSGPYFYDSDYTKFYYFWAEIVDEYESAEGTETYIKYTLKDDEGNIAGNENIKFYVDPRYNKAPTYELEGIRNVVYENTVTPNKNRAVATFSRDGYLVVKYNNIGVDITYSLYSINLETEYKPTN
ncbi:hypothetical protein EPJ67_00710 [Brachyspira aalborgi]|uniref:Lipoprotein n=1 Tax=Brachyspira aalborgi TaxID=29522 RepID=A0A5C8GA39_9SPIR|nr:hypothetical protein [Brachyspira aalborgi]TXJ58687.1 hypothetical protein EPJ67_00710 [Brachyspira aalborgi]